MQMVMVDQMVEIFVVKNKLVKMKLFKNKKGQGLTLNTVIIAVLVLIVLTILIFIAYKYIWGAGNGIGELSNCEARVSEDGQKNGKCVESSAACKTYDTEGTAFYKMGGCPDGENKEEKYCCIPK